MFSTEFYAVVVVAILIISVARLSRLATHDAFPPVKWLRVKVYTALDKSGDWQKITYCPFCISFWITLVVGGWAWWSGVFDGVPDAQPSGWALAWWIINASLAVSYLAAIVVTHDGEEA